MVLVTSCPEDKENQLRTNGLLVSRSQLLAAAQFILKKIFPRNSLQFDNLLGKTFPGPARCRRLYINTHNRAVGMRHM